MQPDPDPTSTVPGMSRWGWMSPAELLWLNARAAEMTSVVEIGCLHGRSSIALVEGCPGTVYCIDPWSDEGWKSWKAGVGDVYPNVIGLRMASPQAADFVDWPVDMTFIDGAHDYASVIADLECWDTRTSKLICGHDYVDSPDAGFPDVARAVNAFYGHHRISVAPDTAIWFVRLD